MTFFILLRASHTNHQTMMMFLFTFSLLLYSPLDASPLCPGMAAERGAQQEWSSESMNFIQGTLMDISMEERKMLFPALILDDCSLI